MLNSRQEAQGEVSFLWHKDSPLTPSPLKARSCHRALFQPTHHTFAYVLTAHCPIQGVPPWAADQHAKAGLAPHLCTTRRDSRLSAGVDCWSAEKRFKVLVAGRPESDAGREKRGVSEFGTSPVQEPPGEGSPLLPHPTAPSQPHAAYLNLQASRQTPRCCLCPSSAARPAQRAGCWSRWIQAAGGERVSSEPHTKVGSGPGSRLSCPHCTPSLTLVIFVSRLVSMGRLPLLMGTVFQPSSATRLPRPPGHKGDRHKAQPGLERCPAGATHP